LQWDIKITSEVQRVEVRKNDELVLINSAVVVKAIQEIQDVEMDRYVEPPLMKPQVRVKELKGPNSVYLEEPWQCSYCPFRDISCKGAISNMYRRSLPDSGLIGHLQPDGSIKIKAGVAPVLADIAKENLP
jgi:hypothetical protein